MVFLKEYGIGNIIILKDETPDAELRWCKSVHNKFHDGCDDTAAEKFRTIPTAKLEWDAYGRISSQWNDGLS